VISERRCRGGILRSLFKLLFRSLYLIVRSAIMARSGLQPKGSYIYSRNKSIIKGGEEHGIPLPNLSGGLQSMVCKYIQIYGLGGRCLLVSESNAVRAKMIECFPGVKFTTVDFYPELMSRELGGDAVDVLWDVCGKPSAELAACPFDSIICNAMLEHVIDPSSALHNMMSLLSKEGHLYITTCSPSFHYHAAPRVYVRFHLDYFHDMPLFLKKHYNINCELLELYSCAGLISACYEKK